MNYLALAYILLWLLVCGYIWRLSCRLRRAEEQLAHLKDKK